ncbi:MAG: response regulator [Bdellovibrionota bacterium]
MSRLQPPKILVVEDTIDILDYVALVFRNAGFSVETATGGIEAFEKFRPGKFDVVLTDVQMPNGNGLDLLAQIRNIDTQTPVFLVTGDPSYLRASVEELGAEEVLMKPIFGSELVQIVRSKLQLPVAV